MPVIKSDVKDGLLTVRQAIEGDRIRIVLEGELDLSNAKTAEAPLLDAIASDSNLLVDLGKLVFVDSTGISLLVTALRDKEGALSFVAPMSAEVQRLLSLTGLDERMQFAVPEEVPGAPAAAAALSEQRQG